eukprot:CAMPEP_0174701272 /NCGR_PEP_ID=MMETSP1094-20130205/5962_1 /TAXON_ID=156173 /ORGANISM="Chrysochromulina brevifilum, Strain UTEX LB 985" /LENGTH=546 /DNA_ID=CAMNT_0015898887 /DNA_START=51 /DNA_END=1691 /DNA_ORIENTATION=+
MIKYMNDIDLKSIRTLEDFLDVLSLRWLSDVLVQHGLTTLEEVVNLTPSAMQEMGITAGQRQRLLRANEMLLMRGVTRQIVATAAGGSSNAPEEKTDNVPMETADTEEAKPRPLYNSTSSLYIDSTITTPDFCQLCFCVSLLVHDLIAEGEAARQAEDMTLMVDDIPANPLTNLHPKEIFSSAKRSREEYEATDRQTMVAAAGGGSAFLSFPDTSQPPSSAPRLMPPTTSQPMPPPFQPASMPPPPPPEHRHFASVSGQLQHVSHPPPSQLPPLPFQPPFQPQPQTTAPAFQQFPLQSMTTLQSLPPGASAPGAMPSVTVTALPGAPPPSWLPNAPTTDVPPSQSSTPTGDGGTGSNSLNDSLKENDLVCMPTENEIRMSIEEMHALTRFTPGCLVVSMIYVERLRRTKGAQLLSSTWQPTIFAALLLAQKVWEDEVLHHRQVDFTRLNEALTKAQLAQLERDFLTALDFNVGVKAAVYTDWYFKLCTLAEKNDLRVRPLDQTEARRLEIRGAIFENQLRSINNRSHSGPMLGAEPPTPRSRAVVS